MTASKTIIERTFLTGVLHVSEDDPIAPPAACIPLALEDRTVGAIVVYSLLGHKNRFVTVDRELFKLLGAHAGGALVSAYLRGRAPGRFRAPRRCASFAHNLVVRVGGRL